MRIAAAPIKDDSGRPLRDPGDVEVFFHLGWKTAVPALGPVHRDRRGEGAADAAAAGLRRRRARTCASTGWIRCTRASGRSPSARSSSTRRARRPSRARSRRRPRTRPATSAPSELMAHIRLLGSPLISRVVELPLASKSGTTTFGLDLGPLLDEAVGRQRPGSYLVGLRRLTGAPERAYVRVQVTNLSLTAVEERDRAVFFVRTLDDAKEVRGAKIVIEGQQNVPDPKHPGQHDVRALHVSAHHGRRGPGDARAAGGLAQPQAHLGPERGGHPRARSALAARGLHPEPLVSVVGVPRVDLAADPASAQRHDASGSSSPSAPSTGPARRSSSRASCAGRRAASCSCVSSSESTSCGWRARATSAGRCRPRSPRCGFVGESSPRRTCPRASSRPSSWRRGRRSEVARRAFQIEAYRVPQFEVQLSVLGHRAARRAVQGEGGGALLRGRQRVRAAHRVDGDAPAVLLRAQGAARASSSPPAPSSPARARAARRRRSAATRSSTTAARTRSRSTPRWISTASARVYHFEATVTGADNQPVSAVTEVKALPPFVLGMKLPRYSEKPFELEAGDHRRRRGRQGVEGPGGDGAAVPPRLAQPAPRDALRHGRRAATSPSRRT